MFGATYALPNKRQRRQSVQAMAGQRPHLHRRLGELVRAVRAVATLPVHVAEVEAARARDRRHVDDAPRDRVEEVAAEDEGREHVRGPRRLVAVGRQTARAW